MRHPGDVTVKALFSLLLEAEPPAPPGAPEEAEDAWSRASDAVRAEARTLLEAHRRARGVLLIPSGAEADGFVAHPPRITGYDIGPPIGRGGFGIVYRARQRAPVERDVAIKVLRTELATADIRERFAAEARVLARLNHPNIARILDAGTDDHRRPFVAMELVSGRPIVEHCDACDLTIRERVRILADVCDAVHHAHQRAIIHRDLKPANILVERIDSRDRPRIIDFGIARIVEDELIGNRTLPGARLGTPKYMSPEQARGEESVDVRSDVYALGILLFETLTGSVPGDVAASSKASGSGTGPRSGTRTAKPSVVAAQSGPEGIRRNGELRGDLDRMTLKAMAHDPEDRYESAAAFADDMRRWLDGQPVRATPPSMFYLTRRFVARHRFASAAILLAVLSLFAGTALALHGRSVADISAMEAHRARVEAEHERDRARMMADFLVGDLIEALNPDLTGESDRSIETLLRYVASEAERRLAHDAMLLTEVLSRVGHAMRTVTDFSAAAATLERAAERSHTAFGESDRRTLNLRIDAALAALSAHQGDDAGRTISEVYEQAARVWGEYDPVALRSRLHMAHLGESQPIPDMEAVLADVHRLGLQDDPLHFETLQYLSRSMRHAGHPDADRRTSEAAVMASERFGPFHSAAMELRLEAASAMRSAGRTESARGALIEIERMTAERFGPANWYRQQALAQLIQLEFANENFAESLTYAREHHSIVRHRQGPESEPANQVQVDIGLIELRAGDAEAALTTLNEVLDRSLRTLPESHPQVLALRHHIAEALLELDRLDDIDSMIEPILQHTRPGRSVRTASVLLAAEADDRRLGTGAGDTRRLTERDLLPPLHPDRDRLATPKRTGD